MLVFSQTPAHVLQELSLENALPRPLPEAKVQVPGLLLPETPSEMMQAFLSVSHAPSTQLRNPTASSGNIFIDGSP